MQSHELGERGEEIAAEYLRNAGYEILARRFKRSGGEIDIVCCRRERGDLSLLVFVEVKTRRPSLWGRPEQAVSKGKMHRMYRTAQKYLFEKSISDVLCRFDVMAVYWVSGRLEVEHFEDAFGAMELMNMD